MLTHPKDWRKDQVSSELLDNFNWLIRINRKRKNLTRKQFAKLLDEPEENIKMVEAGFLPYSDFILINKIQHSLGINLRKDKKDFNKSINQTLEGTNFKNRTVQNGRLITKTPAEIPKEAPPQNTFSGNDIEILDEEL